MAETFIYPPNNLSSRSAGGTQRDTWDTLGWTCGSVPAGFLSLPCHHMLRSPLWWPEEPQITTQWWESTASFGFTEKLQVRKLLFVLKRDSEMTRAILNIDIRASDIQHYKQSNTRFPFWMISNKIYSKDHRMRTYITCLRKLSPCNNITRRNAEGW